MFSFCPITFKRCSLCVEDETTSQKFCTHSTLIKKKKDRRIGKELHTRIEQIKVCPKEEKCLTLSRK